MQNHQHFPHGKRHMKKYNNIKKSVLKITNTQTEEYWHNIDIRHIVTGQERDTCLTFLGGMLRNNWGYIMVHRVPAKAMESVWEKIASSFSGKGI